MEAPYTKSFKATPDNFLEPMGNLFLYDEIAIKEKNRRSNMSKIIESASNGNIVSKKLLKLIQPNTESENNPSRIDSVDCLP
jgi:hypothetical protein